MHEENGEVELGVMTNDETGERRLGRRVRRSAHAAARDAAIGFSFARYRTGGSG